MSRTMSNIGVSGLDDGVLLASCAMSSGAHGVSPHCGVVVVVVGGASKRLSTGTKPPASVSSYGSIRTGCVITPCLDR